MATLSDALMNVGGQFLEQGRYDRRLREQRAYDEAQAQKQWDRDEEKRKLALQWQKARIAQAQAAENASKASAEKSRVGALKDVAEAQIPKQVGDTAYSKVPLYNEDGTIGDFMLQKAPATVSPGTALMAAATAGRSDESTRRYEEGKERADEKERVRRENTLKDKLLSLDTREASALAKEVLTTRKQAIQDAYSKERAALQKELDSIQKQRPSGSLMNADSAPIVDEASPEEMDIISKGQSGQLSNEQVANQLSEFNKGNPTKVDLQGGGKVKQIKADSAGLGSSKENPVSVSWEDTKNPQKMAQLKGKYIKLPSGTVDIVD